MVNLGAFLSYVFVVSFTPGPNNIMSMASSSKFGYKKTLQFILGVCTGFFVLMILCSYFNLFLFNIMPKVKIFMGILGAGYMIFLAIKIMKSKEEIDTKNDESKKNKLNSSRSDINSFFTGMAMQFVNPKAILYGITVISNFIIPYYKSSISFILFSFFFSVVGFMSTSSWALFGFLFNKFLSKYKSQFNIIMGLLLIYSALSVSGITHLFNR